MILLPILILLTHFNGITSSPITVKSESQLMCDFAAGFVSVSADLQGWKCNSSTLIFNICNNGLSKWDGVYCNSDSIIGINLNGFGFSGTISESIGHILNLQYLILESNYLDGTIPSSIGLLENVYKLSISNNRFTGPIPSSLGALTNLEYLNLASNCLSGNIPSSIEYLFKVYYLQFQNNQLTGTIPSAIGNLTSMYYLLLFNNKLTGTIPITIGYLTQMKYLELHTNYLSGPIPTYILNFNKLFALVLSENKLTGTIPANIGVLKYLTYVWLHINKLTGPIPTSIGLLTAVNNFYLNNNELTGTIPTSIGLLSNVALIFLNFNNLSGTIPTTIGLLTQLKYMFIDSNKLTGPIPSSIGYMKSMYCFNPSLNKLSGTLPSSLSLLSTTPLVLYLNNNKLTGTIPNSLNNSYLYSFDFSYNSFTGTVPVWMWEKDIMRSMLFAENFFNGTIPSTIGQTPYLLRIDLASNYLTGTIPTTVGLLTSITSLGFAGNQFTGKIPIEIVNMTSLRNLKLHTNSLTGTIPTLLAAMSSLQLLFLYSNQLTGTLPTQLVINTGMQYLDLYDNYLSGTIPEAIGNCSSMARLVISRNKLTGSLPSSLTKMNKLEHLYLSANKLTGSLPSTFGVWSELKVLELNNNYFTGTLPTTLSLLSSLEEFYLRGNRFEGSITGIFNATRQTLIRNIDISENALTGKVPSDWFNSSVLQIFAATSDCLIMPDLASMCLARNLLVISLDGIQSATNCKNFFFDYSKSTTYSLLHNVKNNIPDCLYALPHLSILHLSGNALTGTIPANVVLGANLTDLTLSYNRLHGHIPEVIQRRNWTTLDLSYNSFSGTLTSSIPTVTDTNTKLSVSINRLSGDIPPSLLHRTDISVVEGNIFQCNFDASRLPSGDAKSSTYNCGSDAFFLSIYIFFGALLMNSLVVAFLIYSKLLTNPFKITLANKGVALVKLMIKSIGLTFALTLFIICIMMPVFGALSRYYGTHSYEYAWSVSAGFLSGHNAKVIMLVVWSGMLLYFIVAYKIIFKSSKTDEKLVIFPEATAMAFIDANPRGLVWDNTVLSVLFMINVLVVFGANAAYVFTTLRGDIYTVIFVQFLLGIFKVIWRYGYIEYIGTFRDYITGHTHRNKHELLFLTLMLVLNNVLLPVFSETAIDSNCIYNVFVSPDPVVSSYNYNVCLSESDPASNYLCYIYGTQTVEISYIPPFIYRHQCCATIIRNYVSVYTYMFMFTALQIPMSAVVVWMRNHFPIGSLLYRLLGLGVHQLHEDTPYLNYPLYVAGLISNIAILVTFGAAFPPLAVIIFLAIVLDAVYVARALPAEAVPIPIDDLGLTLYLVPFSAIFFAFFLFDTSDYQEDTWGRLWASMVIVLVPLAFYLVYRLVGVLKWRTKNYGNIYKAGEGVEDAEGDREGGVKETSQRISTVSGKVGVSSSANLELVPPVIVLTAGGKGERGVTSNHVRDMTNKNEVIYLDGIEWDQTTSIRDDNYSEIDEDSKTIMV